MLEKICTHCNNEVFAEDINMVLVEGNLYHSFCAPPKERDKISCVVCGNEIITTLNGEYDNVLILQPEGGYGLFIDYLSRQEKDNYRIFIDHDCAHKLCEQLPWLNKILSPQKSHSHTLEYHEKNPQHYGWDYDLKP